jgi:predicted nucleic acid-binding protein
VLQEFYIVVTRKIPKPISLSEARATIKNYLKWQIEENNSNSILRASEIQEKHNISFGDALIVTAAQQAGAAKILTEDMNSVQMIEGILIQNPFIAG